MGVTVHYRGSIAALDRVEDFEDPVIDLALEVGGTAHVRRSAADNDPRRIVRGLTLDPLRGAAFARGALYSLRAEDSPKTTLTNCGPPSTSSNPKP